MIDNLGTINVVSSKLVASDPCYELGIWCAAEISGVLNGEYQASVEIRDCDDWGRRVAWLKILHKDFIEKEENEELEKEYELMCGVDSGTFCFSDHKYYADYHTTSVDDEWYESVVIDMDYYGQTVDDKCVLSSSGYGDGGYEVYVLREPRNGYIVGAYVNFLDYEDDDEI